MPGVTRRDLDHVLWRALSDDFAAFHAAFGAQVDDPVCGFDDVEIMLYHHDAVALFNQPVEHFKQLADVFEMEASGWLVEDVERLARRTAAEFLGEFDALRLSAR